MAAKDIEEHQFRKGVSGNPKGRPKGSLNVSTRIKQWVEQSEKVANPLKAGKIEKMTVLDVMILGLVKKARAGDVWAFNALMDRMEGKVADRVELSTPDGPLEHEIRDAEESDVDYTKLPTEVLMAIIGSKKKTKGD